MLVEFSPVGETGEGIVVSKADRLGFGGAPPDHFPVHVVDLHRQEGDKTENRREPDRVRLMDKTAVQCFEQPRIEVKAAFQKMRGRKDDQQGEDIAGPSPQPRSGVARLGYENPPDVKHPPDVG